MATAAVLLLASRSKPKMTASRLASVNLPAQKSGDWVVDLVKGVNPQHVLESLTGPGIPNFPDVSVRVAADYYYGHALTGAGKRTGHAAVGYLIGYALSESAHAPASAVLTTVGQMPADALAGFKDGYRAGLSARPVGAALVAARAAASTYIDRVDQDLKNGVAHSGGGGLSPSAIAHAFHALVNGITSSPLWNVLQTGASLVPGIGTAVSVGMGMAYAYGHDLSLKDAALAAARDALPGGPAAKAGFDMAVGIASGDTVTDAAIAAARNQVPAGPARDAFDAGVAAAKGKNLTDAARDGADQAAVDYLMNH